MTQDSKLSALLYGQMRAHGLRCCDLEQRLSVSPNTLRKWLKHPETADLGTMQRMARLLGIPKADFVDAWTW